MKKLIAMLLCLVMIVGLFAACSTSGSEGTKAPDGTKGTEGTKATDGKDETTKGGYDFPKSATDGVELGALPLVPAGTEASLNIGLPANVNTPDYETNLMTLYFEEKTGVNLEFTLLTAGKENYVAEMNAKIAAGNDLPDVLWYTSYGKDLISQWGNDGYLIDLTPYYEEQCYWFNECYDKSIEMGASEEDTEFYLVTAGIDPISGERYGVPTVSVVDRNYDNCFHQGINKAWLDAVGKEMPRTVEELYDVLVAFKTKDPNGNGIADEIPVLFAGKSPYQSDFTEFCMNAFVYTNDSVFFNVTDGKIWVPYTTDEYREGLKYLNKLYEEDLLSSASWSTDQPALKAILSPADGINTVGCFGGHTTNVWDVNFESIKEYIVFQPMEDATGSGLGGFATWDPITGAWQTHITSSAKDPVLAFRFVDYLLSEEASIIQRYGARVGKDANDTDCNWRYYEGDVTSSRGLPGHIEVIDDPWSKLSNDVWHGGGVRIGWGQTAAPFLPETKTELSNFRTEYYNTVGKYAKEMQPAEQVKLLLYNEEEQEIYTEYFTVVKSEMEKWRGEFVSGARDIDSDTEWAAYKAALEAEGLSKVIEVAQSCHTRMNG